MSDAHARTLYITLDQARFFHVPMEVELVKGGLPVRTISGGRIDLDPDMLAPYEIEETRAKQIVGEQLGAFMAFAGEAVGKLQGLADQLKQVRDQLDRTGRPKASAERAATRRTELSDLLKIDAESVDDPAQVMRGLNALMGRIQAKMADPEALAEAGVREGIRDDLTRLGAAATHQASGEAEAAVDDARAALVELFGSDTTREALRSATDELRRVRQEMQDAGVLRESAPSPNRPDPESGD